MRNVAAAAFIGATIMALPASAADYYLIDANANQISVIDAEAITPNPHGATAPMVAIRRAVSTAGLGFGYAVVTTDFDCTNRRVAAVSLAVFERDGRPSPEQPTSDGKVVWQPVNPNTQAEGAWQFVCAEPAQRDSMGFRLVGMPLDKIVAKIFDGTWPYDRVPSRLQSPPSKP